MTPLIEHDEGHTWKETIEVSPLAEEDKVTTLVDEDEVTPLLEHEGHPWYEGMM